MSLPEGPVLSRTETSAAVFRGGESGFWKATAEAAKFFDLAEYAVVRSKMDLQEDGSQ
jgi:hypothetical protein